MRSSTNLAGPRAPRRRGLAPSSALLLALLAPVAGASCNHPATKDECEEIFKRSAELALKEEKVEDPAVVEQRMAAVRESQGDALFKQCVGKRISKKALECSRKAATAKEMDRCFE